MGIGQIGLGVAEDEGPVGHRKPPVGGFLSRDLRDFVSLSIQTWR